MAGILPAETVTDGGGICTLGLMRDSLVIPFSIFVSPMMGGSPFLTNSYSPDHTHTRNQPFRPYSKTAQEKKKSKQNEP